MITIMKSIIQPVSIAMASTPYRYADRITKRWHPIHPSAHQQIINSLSKSLHINLGKYFDCDLNYMAIALVVLIVIAQLATIVTAGAPGDIKRFETPKSTKDHRHRFTTWIDFQKNTLNQQRSFHHTQAQDAGDILMQLGLMMQARQQRNASEMAPHIFFKYYDRYVCITLVFYLQFSSH